MNKPNTISKCYTDDLTVRAAAVITTELVQQIQTIHESSPIATIAMGRLITGALLMASGLAEKQQVSIRLQGDGPLGQLSADASFESQARVFCANPQLDMDPVDGKLPIGLAVGKGLLTISRFHEFHKHHQISLVEIQTGEIAEDLSYYYQQSHQIPSLVALSVTLNAQGKVEAAGGIILELMPGAPSTVIDTIEAKARSASPLSEMILQGATPFKLVQAYAHRSQMKETQHPHPIGYFCPCTMARVEKTLKLMGKATLAEMILKADPCEVKCHFCGRKYSVPLEALRRLHDELVSP